MAWNKFDEESEQFKEQKSDLGKMIAAREIIRDKFVGPIDDDALYDSAIRGMVSSLGDKYSHYLNAEEYQLYLRDSENKFVGIGISAALNSDGNLLVTEVYEKSPAEQSGIGALDLITAVDGKSVAEMGFQMAVGAIDGVENTAVHLTILHPDGTTTDVTTVRRVVDLQAVSSEILEGLDIGLVRIRNFDAGADRDFREVVARLQNAGVKAIIFDVRYNPGGQLDVMCPMLDTLLPEGLLITLRGKDGIEQPRTSEASEVNLPMAVLINSHSYSAAEFFAAALHEYGKAVLIGAPTTGKGFAQRPIPLADKSAIILSTLEYFTPQGKSLSGVGLTPDHTVNLSEEEEQNFYALTHEQDKPLQKAIEVLTMEVTSG
jgi:carboxyl-terminal processing protease